MFFIVFFGCVFVYSIVGMIRKRRVKRIVFEKDVYFINQRVKIRNREILIPMN
jgi:hypothetical protein